MKPHDDLESGERTSSSTTSATTVMLVFRPRTSAKTATGSVHGLSSNATALRGACSTPIVHSGSNNCRGGPGGHAVRSLSRELQDRMPCDYATGQVLARSSTA